MKTRMNHVRIHKYLKQARNMIWEGTLVRFLSPEHALRANLRHCTMKHPPWNIPRTKCFWSACPLSWSASNNSQSSIGNTEWGGNTCRLSIYVILIHEMDSRKSIDKLTSERESGVKKILLLQCIMYAGATVTTPMLWEETWAHWTPLHNSSTRIDRHWGAACDSQTYFSSVELQAFLLWCK